MGFAFKGMSLPLENDTYSGEGIISGIFDKASFSVGYSKFDTNGWRENADQEDDLVNAFVQYQITPQTSIQAEYRFRETYAGDTALRFLQNDFRPLERTESRTKTVRVGFHHSFSPNSDLIGTASYQTFDSRDNLPGPVVSVDFGVETDDSFSGELQYLFRSNDVNIVAGGGLFDINSDLIQSVVLDPAPFCPAPFPLTCPPVPIVDPPPLAPVDIPSNQDQDHQNVYLYSYIKPINNLTLILGGSADFLNTGDSALEERNQFNPKLGIIFEPIQGTTLRAAAFRVLKRTLLNQQTVEPTHVAGFQPVL